MGKKDLSKDERRVGNKFRTAKVSDFNDEREYRSVRKKLKKRMSKIRRKGDKLNINDL